MKKLFFGLIILAFMTYILFTLTRPAKNIISQPQTTSPSPTTQQIDQNPVTIIAQNLEVPWSLVFLPDKSLLFTERAGRVRLIDANGVLKESPIAVISDAKAVGEGGLLGIAIHPDFKKNKYLYLYYTYSSKGNDTMNRVVRYEFDGQKLSQRKILIDAIPGNVFHNGGRIKFGPDGDLYITTGDAQNPSLAQNKKAFAGKILRVTDEGRVAIGNPFGNEIYSYGHRNPQGISWDSQGRLWETEHGNTATDELNLIEKGLNYGWPTIRGTQKNATMQPPILQSSTDTWAPSGTVFYNGSIFFAGLKGQALFEAKINGNSVDLKTHFKNEFGRIRDVIVGPDNMLYIATSNRDGRGAPKSGDDKIIRINPEKL